MANILIVDDSEMMRLTIMKTLKFSGHTFLTAENGIDGLYQIKKHSDIDLILCDINMPEMDGITMISKLTCDTPVIIITTETFDEIKYKGKLSKVIAWATKPFNSIILLETINKIIKGDIRSKL